MFSRFTTALYNAVDALAPPLPLQEDFVWHWKSVTKFYTGRTSSAKLPIEVTSIPGHLMEMSSILEQEEKESEQGNIGPCMEYIMQHKLLDTMCVLGTADTPLGMRRFMFIFVTRMLRSTQQSLIPHVSIYSPIQKFIQLCGEVLAAPTEKEEIELLEVVCDKLKENPHLVNCFVSSVSGSKPNSSSDVKPSKVCVQFPLIDSLLKLFQSPDNEISTRATDCLRLCCSIANDATAMAVIQQTQMSVMMCKTLELLYKSLPKSMKLSDIEDPVPHNVDEQGECPHISSERRKFLCYLQHLHILDTIVEEAHPVIAEDIANCFSSKYLGECIYSDFIESKNPDDNLFATAVISSSMRNISSSTLLSSIGAFLLGDASEFELPGHSCYLVKDLLIERCRNSHINLALSMSSLQLFEELLQNPTEDIMHNLVVNNLESRGYYDHTSADDWLSFSDDDSNRYPGDDEVLPDTTSLSKTYAPSYIHKILECFLSLVPNNLKSCETEEESGYDIYIKEAHGRFVKCLMQCENFDWPPDPVSREEYHLGPEDDSSSDSQPEADSSRWVFYEGAFLNMIFEKLEQMLDQPYDINLQVTSLVSKLALFAHPNLHEYLLNPLIPYTSGARSLFLVLLKVIEDIQVEVKNVRPFRAKLKQTRIALLSDGNECPDFEKSNVLEALIVIEEFCKELAAIAFVKYHAAS